MDYTLQKFPFVYIFHGILDQYEKCQNNVKKMYALYVADGNAFYKFFLAIFVKNTVFEINFVRFLINNCFIVALRSLVREGRWVVFGFCSHAFCLSVWILEKRGQNLQLTTGLRTQHWECFMGRVCDVRVRGARGSPYPPL